jgi:hypothetical protein
MQRFKSMAGKKLKKVRMLRLKPRVNYLYVGNGERTQSMTR